MNERIRELAEQTFFDETTSQPSDKMYTFSDHKMQKFAELIVQECINLCDKEYVAQIGTPAGAYNSAVKKCRDRIAENFGISE